MTIRPDLPKRMAAKIRAVYARALAARSSVASSEAKSLDLTLHLNEYDADPMRFAELHYPSCGGPDSYPVQTNIQRSRDALDLRPERLAFYFSELASAEAELLETEHEVLNELAAIRPETPGRVPWPSEPRSLDALRRENLAWVKKNRNASLKWLRRQEIRDLEYKRKRQERAAAFQLETDRLFQQSLESMPSDKAVVYRAFYDSVTTAMQNGNFGAREIYALAAGNADPIAPILDATRAKLAQTKTSDGAGEA